jgi:hypothetical protein
MNCPEKISGAYLRLNGFFLLLHFTLFDGNNHTHVDFLGLRPPEGKEICQNLELPVDNQLFNVIENSIRNDPFTKLLGVIVEVKGGEKKEIPLNAHINYAINFFGRNVCVVPLSFAEISNKQPSIEQGSILIPLKYALKWTLFRFHWMNKNLERLSKSGSWSWSEDFLADLLYLQKLDIGPIDSDAQHYENDRPD